MVKIGFEIFVNTYFGDVFGDFEPSVRSAGEKTPESFSINQIYSNE